MRSVELNNDHFDSLDIEQLRAVTKLMIKTNSLLARKLEIFAQAKEAYESGDDRALEQAFGGIALFEHLHED